MPSIVNIIGDVTSTGSGSISIGSQVCRTVTVSANASTSAGEGAVTTLITEYHTSDYRGAVDGSDSDTSHAVFQGNGVPKELQAYINGFKGTESFQDSFRLLGLEPEDGHVCRISEEVPNIPVYLGGQLYDWAVLKECPTDPFTREKYTLRDVMPARNTRDFLEEKIKRAQEATKVDQTGFPGCKRNQGYCAEQVTQAGSHLIDVAGAGRDQFFGGTFGDDRGGSSRVDHKGSFADTEDSMSGELLDYISSFEGRELFEDSFRRLSIEKPAAPLLGSKSKEIPNIPVYMDGCLHDWVYLQSLIDLDPVSRGECALSDIKPALDVCASLKSAIMKAERAAEQEAAKQAELAAELAEWAEWATKQATKQAEQATKQAKQAKQATKQAERATKQATKQAERAAEQVTRRRVFSSGGDVFCVENVCVSSGSEADNDHSAAPMHIIHTTGAPGRQMEYVTSTASVAGGGSVNRDASSTAQSHTTFFRGDLGAVSRAVQAAATLQKELDEFSFKETFDGVFQGFGKAFK